MSNAAPSVTFSTVPLVADTPPPQYDHVAEAHGILDAIEDMAARQGRPVPSVALDFLRAFLLLLLAEDVNPARSLEWIESTRAARRLQGRLDGGAVLTRDAHSGCFILTMNGAEVVRAMNLGELALLLSLLDGKQTGAKRGIVVKIGPMAGRASRTRHQGESMAAQIRCAILAEVERRELALAEEMADIEDLDGPEEDDGDDMARDGLATLGGGLQ